MVLKQNTEPGVSQGFTFDCNHCQKRCQQGSPPELIATIMEGEPVKYSACTDCARLIYAYVEEEEYKKAEKECGHPLKRNHKPGVAAMLKKQAEVRAVAKATEVAKAKAIDSSAEVAALQGQIAQLTAMVQSLAESKNGKPRAATRPKKPKEVAKATVTAKPARSNKRVSRTKDTKASTKPNRKGR